MGTLNLGILAHVDAGKTTLTERLLFAAGVIDDIGSVDRGNTQTDSLALEQKRGITIKSAVVSFAVGGVGINLIDTPGHPDFIAEVERVLGVLDGVVLVVSAVEGVQAQTRVLMRTLGRLGIPTLIFVNKIDRRGARSKTLLRSISERLTPAIVPMGSVSGLGTRGALSTPYDEADAGFVYELVEQLADHDDALLAQYVDGTKISYPRLRQELAAQTGRSLLHPVYFGSAVTGAGLEPLISGITELLPVADGDENGPVSGTVFKVDRGMAGEKIAYVRMFSGKVRVRDRLHLRGDEEKITAINVFDRGSSVRSTSVGAGRIGKLWGLNGVRIGDAIGDSRASAGRHYFAPPTLETAVVPCRADEKGALHAALGQLADQDPLINLRQDDVRRELYLSLYGEVQKEVIGATLADEFGLAVAFRETTTICIERPTGTGAAVELLPEARSPETPFLAAIGLRIEPGAPGSGVRFDLEVKVGSIPLHVYKTVEAFHEAVERTVLDTLRQGIYGWEVTDCTVTMTDCDYQAPPRRWPGTAASDFRLLTPLVLMGALRRAGTVVCEPIHRFHLEIPTDVLGPVLSELARLLAVPQTQEMHGSSCTLEGDIPVAKVHALQQRLRALARGEGVLECAFDSYRPVVGTSPTRPRTDHNPLDPKEYLLRVARRVSPDGRFP
jgi:ribosomal protection tetracycline resistance protein